MDDFHDALERPAIPCRCPGNKVRQLTLGIRHRPNTFLPKNFIRLSLGGRLPEMVVHPDIRSY